MEAYIVQVRYLLIAMALILAPGYLLMLLSRWRRSRRSSICPEALRGPGESRRGRIASIDDRIGELSLLLFAIPLGAAFSILAPALLQGGGLNRQDWLRHGILMAVLTAIPLGLLSRKLRERGDCRLALDTELAVGRELNLVMREGFHVFHDFLGDHDNIDHVVVGPTGVFAVETKGRPKTQKDRKTGHATVIYDGEFLYFPDNSREGRAVARARNQAAYLADWLADRVGESVPVRPALALPGWFVERKKPDDLVILYGQSRHYARILKANGQEIISDSLITRIVEQLDAKCREMGSKVNKAKSEANP